MARRVAFDTSFLIDHQRERSGGRFDGPAHRFLKAEPEVELHLSVVALGDFAEGFADREHALLTAIRELHVLLPIDEETALRYGSIARALRRSGRLLGANDLWIAATSLRHELPLVTSNPAEFRRVEGLEVIAYR